MDKREETVEQEAITIGQARGDDGPNYCMTKEQGTDTGDGTEA